MVDVPLVVDVSGFAYGCVLLAWGFDLVALRFVYVGGVVMLAVIGWGMFHLRNRMVT